MRNLLKVKTTYSQDFTVQIVWVLRMETEFKTTKSEDTHDLEKVCWRVSCAVLMVQEQKQYITDRCITGDVTANVANSNTTAVNFPTICDDHHFGTSGIPLSSI